MQRTDPPLVSEKLTKSLRIPPTLHPDNNKPLSTSREENIIIEGDGLVEDSENGKDKKKKKRLRFHKRCK